jgi:hypothetical protein
MVSQAGGSKTSLTHKAYTLREEIANRLIHGFGTTLSATGLAVLLIWIAGCAAPKPFVSLPAEPLTQYLHLEIAPVECDFMDEINQDIMNEIMVIAIKNIIALNRFVQVAIADSIVRLQLNNLDTVNTLPDSVETAAVLQVTVLLYYIDPASQSTGSFMYGMPASGTVKLDILLLDKHSGEGLAQAKPSAGIVGGSPNERAVVIPLSQAIVTLVNQSF